MTYKEWKSLNKTASMDKKAITLFSAIPAVFDAGGWFAAALLAAAGGVGGSAGWIAAKLNAHDKQDIGTIQKEYENERLKADMGYLATKSKQELEDKRNKNPQKAIRMFE